MSFPERLNINQNAVFRVGAEVVNSVVALFVVDHAGLKPFITDSGGLDRCCGT